VCSLRVITPSECQANIESTTESTHPRLCWNQWLTDQSSSCVCPIWEMTGDAPPIFGVSIHQTANLVTLKAITALLSIVLVSYLALTIADLTPGYRKQLREFNKHRPSLYL